MSFILRRINKFDPKKLVPQNEFLQCTGPNRNDQVGTSEHSIPERGREGQHKKVRLSQKTFSKKLERR